MINIPKGTKDVLPAESYKWHYVENTAREIADLYCLNEIRTPTFEHTELFLRGVGETTDVVNKEMLKEAQKDQAKYATLQIRVCGWNEYFVRMSKAKQDYFIASAEE